MKVPLTARPTGARPMSSPKTPPATYPPGMRGFFAWMRVRNPRLYKVGLPAMNRSGAVLAGLGDNLTIPEVVSQTGPITSTLSQNIKDILMGVSQAYLTNEQMKAQKKVLDVQIARAQAGLPPLDIDMSKYGMGPSATVGISQDTQRLLLWIAAGLGAVYLVPKLLRRS